MAYDESEFAADQVLQDLQTKDSNPAQGTLNEALRRVEEANLLMALVNKDLFSADSARPEILDSVQSRLKAWAISEIETLLNLAQSKPTPQPQKQLFDEDEAGALRILASKVLKRDTPALQVSLKEPELKQVTAQPSALARPVQAKVYPKPAGEKAAPDRTKNHAKISKPAGGAKPIPMASAAQAMDIASRTAGAAGAKVGELLIPAGQNESVQMAHTKSNLIAAAIAQLTGGNQVAVLGDNPSDNSGDVNERV